VVDDEPDVEVTIRQRFRPQVRRGVYEFFFAQNGAAALQVLREHDDIDVVLSDINMPEMDGLAFLANARAMNPVRRVVMVSAYGDVANIRTAMNREAFEFVLKPIDFADLEATIKKAVAELAVLREALRRWTEAERARANLARYFSPSIVDMLSTSDDRLRTAWRADVAVLFADIVGLTTFAESVAPEEVLRLLREFHGAMEAEVYQHGGSLEKYIGDALLASFGVPSASGRDAARALGCARHAPRPHAAQRVPRAPRRAAHSHGHRAPLGPRGARRHRHRAQRGLRGHRRHGEQREPAAGRHAGLRRGDDREPEPRRRRARRGHRGRRGAARRPHRPRRAQPPRAHEGRAALGAASARRLTGCWVRRSRPRRRTALDLRDVAPIPVPSHQMRNDSPTARGIPLKTPGFAVALGARDLRIVWDRRENSGVRRRARCAGSAAHPGQLSVVTRHSPGCIVARGPSRLLAQKLGLAHDSATAPG
jgi:CheY-like chemotaxis protein